MKTKLFSVLALSAILFVSCDNEESPSEINDGRVQFSSQVAGLETRVSGEIGNIWDEEDAIGIYMVEHGEPLSDESIKEGVKNVKYTASSAGMEVSFTPASTPIYYPVNGPKVDFIAYHPYSETAIEDDGNYWYELDVLNQSNQSAIDLMVASADNEGEGYDKINTHVNLNFRHVLAKVVINVQKGDGVTDLNGLQVKVSGMHHLLIYDLSDFAFIGSGVTGTPVMTPYDAGNNRYELILPPTEMYSLGNCKVSFTVGGNTYEWIMTENDGNIDKLEGGMKYTFGVSLTKHKAVVTGSITPWGDGGSASGVAN